MAKWTREKRLEYNKKYWHANKERLLAGRSKYAPKARLYNQKRRHANKIKAFRLVKTALCCQRCGYDKLAALHYHHRDKEQKLFEIMKVLSSTAKIDWKAVELEIQKCDLLCANCHLLEHTTFTEDVYRELI